MISGPLKILQAELPNGLASLLTRPSTSINRFVLNILGETVGSFLGLYGPPIHRSFRFVDLLGLLNTLPVCIIPPAFRVWSSPFLISGPVSYSASERSSVSDHATACWAAVRSDLLENWWKTTFFTLVEGLDLSEGV